MSILILLASVGIISVLLLSLVSIFNNVYGVTVNNSDYYLEAYAIEDDTDTAFESIMDSNALNITKFELRGIALNNICNSGQCRIEYNNNSALDTEYFTRPDLEHGVINYAFPFTLKNEIPNSSIGPIKKHYLEAHSSSMFGCIVTDVVEDNGQEVYYCNDASVAVARDFDSKVWHFDTKVKYDAKKHILIVNGNYTE